MDNVLPPNRTKPKKTFSVKTWAGGAEGEKMLLYGKSGMGKTSLASMAPGAVFIGLDDGGRKINNPKTGEPLQFIDGITTFDDVRDALRTPGLLANHETLVVDTITVLESLAMAYTLKTVAGPQNKPATNVESYGFGKGYRHLFDSMALVLQDCDPLVRAGKNILFIAQSKAARVANPGGEDYLQDTPSLFSGNPSIAALYIEWCDHVLALRYNDLKVEHKKVAGGQRVIVTTPEPYFEAKSRTLKEPVISFDSVEDDSVWTFLFGGK